jgi:alkylation response protein AidB-like acyl-CoA dehydrogenase
MTGRLLEFRVARLKPQIRSREVPMDYAIFSEEHEIFRRQLTTFLDREIRPHVEEWEAQGRVPRDLWYRMGELGFLGFCYDPEYGGAGVDQLFSVVLAQEFGRSRAGGFSGAVTVHNDMSSTYIDLLGTPEQKKRFLTPCTTGRTICGIAITEPGAGSDVAGIRTTARRDGDSYVIDGQKTFITNGYYADTLVVAAKTDPHAKPPHKGVSLLVVPADTPGFTRGRKLEKMGNSLSDTAELFFEDCRVPASHLLGQEGDGFKAIMMNFQKERLIAAVLAIVACEIMLEGTIQYCRERKAFGRRISSFQVNAHKIVDMATQIEMARLLVLHCCEAFSRGQNIVKEISMAKYHTAELANQVAYHCVQLHGGYGYMREYPICRAYMDVRVMSIAGGTTEIMKEIVARSMGL